MFSAVYRSMIRKHAPERSILSGACLLVLTSAHGQFPSVYYRLVLNIVSVFSPPHTCFRSKKMRFRNNFFRNRDIGGTKLEVCKFRRVNKTNFFMFNAARVAADDRCSEHCELNFNIRI